MDLRDPAGTVEVAILIGPVLSFLGTVADLLTAFGTTERRLTEIRDVLIEIRDARR